MNDYLLQQFMEEEITCAFKTMEPLKVAAVMDFQQFSFKGTGKLLVLKCLTIAYLF